MLNTAPRRIPTGQWYFVITVLTGGILAWVPFLHAAQRLGRPAIRRRAAAYGGVAVVITALSSMTPDDAAGNPIGATGRVLQTISAIVVLAAIVVACLQLSPLRREVYGIVVPPYGAPVARGADPAVARVLAARARRVEARAIITNDPLMARELCIGRPDRPRSYDDGGLVDLNNAPAAAIAGLCGIPAPAAESFARTRETRGVAFVDVDEALILAEIPVQFWDQIRDRAVVLP
jgi:hypothetical protein